MTPKNTSYGLDSKATYLVARWLALRGARHLALLCRSGPATPAAQSLVSDLQSQGVEVATPQCDITSAKTVSEVIKELAHSMPLIGGCT